MTQVRCETARADAHLEHGLSPTSHVLDCLIDQISVPRASLLPQKVVIFSQLGHREQLAPLHCLIDLVKEFI
eukprot:CAMPEP_0185585456 /NCGR_PEP_ID=MMETSP0434-20130131/38831_1 /TAXON_ID=626734 ORGANISM="Favella taraikaensis, Strain Fe Narragansett Bay" /NCGR_SAMPLE_ID=MMETSP0434 /ASSEMBLY_ACC=CAM_ASM_000379 /LENGTH=71 /DNA_ID=CAMNT_0028205803 /DNA_START=1209 /DNA_END=1424 /DNA_ORIENTATION=-